MKAETLDTAAGTEREALLDDKHLPRSAHELLQRYGKGERNFIGAKLAGADFTNADLRDVNLSDADLSGASFEDADLRNANLQSATCIKTNFRDANLENADLTKAIALLPAQLAGTNLWGARMPERLGDFDGLKVVEEESKNARQLFFVTLAACLYSWLTIATTTDVLLLTNSTSSPLPIIGASIPIVSFYVVGPLVLMLLYIYLHLHLERLWERLADLPAVFPDGRSLGKRAYPWLLVGLVYSFNPYLKDRRPPLSRLQTVVTVLTTWWLMPLTVLMFWLRYLRRHDWLGTGLHIVLVVATIAAGIALYRLAASTLRGQRQNPRALRSVFSRLSTYLHAGWLAALAAICLVLSYGAIEGVPPDFEVVEGEKSLIDADAPSSDPRRWVPVFFHYAGFKPAADLREIDVSTKLQNWKGQQDDELNMVKRGRLRQANLRFVDATRAFLVGADLARSNLQGAYLYHAQLRRADLSFADLKEAFAYEADFQGANLANADLRGADFTGADLSGANLKGARLDGAKLENTKLAKAQLNGTSLAAVKGLTGEQVQAAITDDKTQLPENLTNNIAPKS